MPVSETLEFLTGDYPSRLESVRSALGQALKDAGSGPPLTLLEEDPVALLTAEAHALKAEAVEAGTVITVTAIGRKTWRKLKDKHPARSGEGVTDEVAEQDRRTGLNGDSVEDDLVHASVTFPADKGCVGDMRHKDEVCSTDNPCSQREAFDEWADGLSEGEWKSTLYTAWGLANGASLAPKGV